MPKHVQSCQNAHERARAPAGDHARRSTLDHELAGRGGPPFRAPRIRDPGPPGATGNAAPRSSSSRRFPLLFALLELKSVENLAHTGSVYGAVNAVNACPTSRRPGEQLASANHGEQPREGGQLARRLAFSPS